MRAAIVHDDLVQWGGAERVLLAICEAFPEAPIYTSVVDWHNPPIKEAFASKEIKTSFMQRFFRKSLYKVLLPFYPVAFEQFDFSDYDLVLSHTTRFAKAVITKPETRHLCYSHTPPRFLWNLSGERWGNWLNPYFSYLKIFDLVSSSRVDQWVAGSKNAAKRIQKIYGAKAELLYPFVDDHFFERPLIGPGDYYISIARLNQYKRLDLVIKACQEMKRKLIIIGKGPELEKLKSLDPTVTYYHNLSESGLIEKIRHSRGVIVAAEEDFGLISAEAQALGRGVIGFGKGGTLETVVTGKTGVLFNEQSVESLVKAIKKFEQLRVLPSVCRANAKQFSKKNFQKRLQLLANAA